MDIVYIGLAGLCWLAIAGAGLGLPSAAGPGSAAMSAWNLIAAVLAAGLLVYLVAVLLRPEDFS